tara:strand:+ start:1361 stop:2602 length:1242 start_codon:yes stop_codon:yes gene_type:complete
MSLWLKKYWSLVIFLIGVIIFCLIEAQGKGDFYIFLSASRDIFKGINIYATTYVDGYHYYYDTFFALLISPLQLLPLYVAKVIWLISNVWFTYRIWKICSYYLPIDILSPKKKKLFTTLCFIFVFSLWQRNIHLAQMTIFLLFLSLEGLYQVQQKRIVVGSLLISIGITVKLLPLLLIPYLIYRAKWKATSTVIIGVIAVLFLPSLVIGFDYNLFLLKERWDIINPINSEHVLDVSERSFHSLTTLLSTLLIEDASNPYTLDLKRNIANISIEQFKIVITLVRLAFIIFALYFLNSLPFTNPKNKIQSFYEMSYIFLAIPLIFPHQQHYAFYFAFPTITYILFYFFYHNFFNGQPTKKYVVIALLFVIFFLLNSHFILGAYRDLYDHYKTLTYGILMLITFLFFFKPNQINIL